MQACTTEVNIMSAFVSYLCAVISIMVYFTLNVYMSFHCSLGITVIYVWSRAAEKATKDRRLSQERCHLWLKGTPTSFNSCLCACASRSERNKLRDYVPHPMYIQIYSITIKVCQITNLFFDSSMSDTCISGTAYKPYMETLIQSTHEQVSAAHVTLENTSGYVTSESLSAGYILHSYTRAQQAGSKQTPCLKYRCILNTCHRQVFLSTGHCRCFVWSQFRRRWFASLV